jgi:hypothetical protein
MSTRSASVSTSQKRISRHSPWHVWIAFRHISRYRDISQLLQVLFTWSTIVHVELLFRAREPPDAYICKGMLPNADDDPATVRAKQQLIKETKKNRKKVLARGFNWFTITVSPPEVGQPPETQMVTSKTYNRSYRFMRLPLTQSRVTVDTTSMAVGTRRVRERVRVGSALSWWWQRFSRWDCALTSSRAWSHLLKC